jgi:pimeloyl-ACP methyl ester carboxylesterase
MNAFYFGTGERRLFGIYEPAVPGSGGTRAAVLCHPWGREYLHAHRAMRQLAIRLSVAGYHTLRFDYFGTGDSAGDMEDADLAGWESDIDAAIAEIRDIVGAPQVALIGLRLGATVAARVAARGAARGNRVVDTLVLWDPILSTAGWLAPLDEVMARHQGAPGDVVEMQGFRVGAAMLQDFRSIDLHAMLAAPVVRSFMPVTERTPAHASLDAKAAGGLLDIEYIDSSKPWIDDFFTGGTLPVEVIRRIVEWLA